MTRIEILAAAAQDLLDSRRIRSTRGYLADSNSAARRGDARRARSLLSRALAGFARDARTLAAVSTLRAEIRRLQNRARKHATVTL